MKQPTKEEMMKFCVEVRKQRPDITTEEMKSLLAFYLKENRTTSKQEKIVRMGNVCSACGVDNEPLVAFCTACGEKIGEKDILPENDKVDHKSQTQDIVLEEYDKPEQKSAVEQKKCKSCEAELADDASFCVACGQSTSESDVKKKKYHFVGTICSHCERSIEIRQPVTVCPKCGEPHHSECWKDNDYTCAVPDCGGREFPDPPKLDKSVINNIQDSSSSEKKDEIALNDTSIVDKFNRKSNFIISIKDASMKKKACYLGVAGLVGFVLSSLWMHYAAGELSRKLTWFYYGVTTALLVAPVSGMLATMIDTPNGGRQAIFRGLINGFFSSVLLRILTNGMLSNTFFNPLYILNKFRLSDYIELFVMLCLGTVVGFTVGSVHRNNSKRAEVIILGALSYFVVSVVIYFISYLVSFTFQSILGCIFSPIVFYYGIHIKKDILQRETCTMPKIKDSVEQREDRFEPNNVVPSSNAFENKGKNLVDRIFSIRNFMKKNKKALLIAAVILIGCSGLVIYEKVELDKIIVEYRNSSYDMEKIWVRSYDDIINNASKMTLNQQIKQTEKGISDYRVLEKQINEAINRNAFPLRHADDLSNAYRHLAVAVKLRIQALEAFLILHKPKADQHALVSQISRSVDEARSHEKKAREIMSKVDPSAKTKYGPNL